MKKLVLITLLFLSGYSAFSQDIYVKKTTVIGAVENTELVKIADEDVKVHTLGLGTHLIDIDPVDGHIRIDHCVEVSATGDTAAHICFQQGIMPEVTIDASALWVDTLGKLNLLLKNADTSIKVNYTFIAEDTNGTVVIDSILIVDGDTIKVKPDSALNADNLGGESYEYYLSNVTKTLYVDGNRGDAYSETGSILSPYKTIQAAITASGSGTTILIAASAYTEDLTLKANVDLVATLPTTMFSRVTIVGKITCSLASGSVMLSGILASNTTDHALSFIGTNAQKLRAYNCKFETNGAGVYHAINYTNTNASSELYIQHSLLQVLNSSAGARGIYTSGTSSGTIGAEGTTVKISDTPNNIVIELNGSVDYWHRIDQIQGQVTVSSSATCALTLLNLITTSVATIVTNSSGATVLGNCVITTTASPTITGAGLFAYSGVVYASSGIGFAGTLNGGGGAHLGALKMESSYNIIYDNTASGLSSTTLKLAIDELKDSIDIKADTPQLHDPVRVSDSLKAGISDSLLINTNSLVVRTNGNVGIGTSTPRYRLDVIDSIAGGATIKNAGNFQLTFSSGTQSAESNAIVADLTLMGSAIFSGSMADAPAGISGFVVHASTGTVEEAYGIAGGFTTMGANPVGTVTLGVGVLGLVMHDTTGTITQASALKGVIQNVGSGTITDAIGIDFPSLVNSGGGTITNAYGIKLGDINAGTNNWAIKTGTGTVSFGDNVGIGTISPTSKLQVVGLSVYANNGAAVAGGLTVGAFYRTGGDPDLVCVVH